MIASPLTQYTWRTCGRRVPGVPSLWLRFCTSSSSSGQSKWEIQDEVVPTTSFSRHRGKLRIDHKFSKDDLDRFGQERKLFRTEPRLAPDTILTPAGNHEMDWLLILKGFVSVTRVGDLLTDSFTTLLYERLSEDALMQSVGVPPMLDAARGIASKQYEDFRMQMYWFALHVWLIHSKQHMIQDGEGLFVSAMCAVLTRRLFEWQWKLVRMWIHDTGVPAMSVTDELTDLQEYVFGLCVTLDQAWKDEAASGTETALRCTDGELQGQCGLVPLVKHVLWANVYSGTVEHDSTALHELVVYLIRQRVMLERLPRGAFFAGDFTWCGMK